MIAPRLIASLVGDAPGLPLGPSVWEGTQILPPAAPNRRPLVDLFTGRQHDPGDQGLLIADILSDFPVSILIAS